MRIVMAIPSYWCGPKGWQAEDAVFDHPTPLGQPGTLGRALESLRALSDHDFELVVLAVPTTPDIATEVRSEVAGIIRDSQVSVPTYLFSMDQVASVGKILSSQGRDDLLDLVGLDGYGQVRNACLLAAQMLAADAVVLIDDDEVFNDPRFLHKIHESLSSGVSGLAGYYVDRAGSFILDKELSAWEEQWGKQAAMNQAFRRIIGAPPRLKVTPFAFGGNMIITRDLYTSIPFDPKVPRGEDIDYVINAAISGFSFQLDNTLAITHLPPPHSHPAWMMLKQDVTRFAYERDKLQGAGVEASVFDPFPGPFLGPDLAERVRKTCNLLADKYRGDGDVEGALRTQEIGEDVSLLKFPQAFEGYSSFRQRWVDLMQCLAKEGMVDHVFSEP